MKKKIVARKPTVKKAPTKSKGTKKVKKTPRSAPYTGSYNSGAY